MLNVRKAVALEIVQAEPLQTFAVTPNETVKLPEGSPLIVTRPEPKAASRVSCTAATPPDGNGPDMIEPIWSVCAAVFIDALNE
jgi:hypothetical protein